MLIQINKKYWFYFFIVLKLIPLSLAISSICCSQLEAIASVGIRQSPLGLRLTEPTLGPSGRQERLNC